VGSCFAAANCAPRVFDATVMPWERRIGNRKTPYLMFQPINFAASTGLMLSTRRYVQHKNADGDGPFRHRSTAPKVHIRQGFWQSLRCAINASAAKSSTGFRLETELWPRYQARRPRTAERPAAPSSHNVVYGVPPQHYQAEFPHRFRENSPQFRMVSGWAEAISAC
jgi:hypothetical protein